MNNFFTSLYPVINLHKKMSIKAEIVTQMIYGESFSILKSNNKWLKIKILEDNYKGFIKRRDFAPYIKSTHKVYSLKANIYKFPNNKKKVSELTFGSKIKIKAKKLGFFKFNKGWINQKEVKTASFKEKNIFKKISIFENIKYKWGGKTFKGIDCSALIQVFFNFNNKYCPRDVKDQIRYFKKNTMILMSLRVKIIYLALLL